MKHLFLYYLLLFTTTCLAMELEKEYPFFNTSPNEMIYTIFSWLVPICQDQKEVFKNFKTLQLVNKRCFTLINDVTFTKKFALQLHKKFITKDLNIYELLHTTSTTRSMLNHTLQILKTAAQYALLYHHEMCTELGKKAESYEYDTINSLIQSKGVIQEQNRKTEFTKICNYIDEKFIKFITIQDPKIKRFHFSKKYDPHLSIALLLYIAQNSKRVFKTVLKTAAPLEKTVQLFEIINSLDNNYTHLDFWRPYYITVEKIFKNRPETKKIFICQSKLLYDFI